MAQQERRRYPKGKKRKLIVYIVTAVQCILSVLLGWMVISLGMLPTSYVVAYIVVLLIFNGLTILSAQKRATAIVMCTLSILLSVVMGYGLHALYYVHSAIEDVTETPEETEVEIAVITLANSKIEELADLSGASIGYLTGEDMESMEEVMEEIDEVTKNEVTYQEYAGLFEMVDALYDQTESAILLDTALIEVIEGVEEYADFSARISKLHISSIVAATKPEKEEEKDPLDQFIVYISGIDTTGKVTNRSNSDVNILAVVNTKTRQVQLINTPRDYFVELPNSNGVKDKLTHAGIYGIENSIGTLEMIYDIDVSYYVRMNFSGFKEIINALGGIEVYSDYTFDGHGHSFTKGVNYLDGESALAFARERKSFGSGDIQRGKHQMAVITAVINKILSTDILYRYAEVLSAIGDAFQTDMTSEEIYTLVRMQLENPGDWEINSYTVTGSNGNSTTFSMPNMNNYVMIPDETTIAQAKSLIQSVLKAQ